MRPVSASSRAHRKRPTRWWIHAFSYGIVLSFLGDPLVAGERLELDNFSAYPPQPKIELDLDDGSTCAVTDRAPPTLVFYGRQLNSIDQPKGSDLGMKSDLGGGVALVIPIGGTGFKQKCSGLLKLQKGRAKMALANQMLEAGQPTEADMKKLIEKMRVVLGI